MTPEIEARRTSEPYTFPLGLHEQLRREGKEKLNKSRRAENLIRLGLKAEAEGMTLGSQPEPSHA